MRISTFVRFWIGWAFLIEAAVVGDGVYRAVNDLEYSIVRGLFVGVAGSRCTSRL